MILRDVLLVWVAASLAIFLVIYLGVHLADLLVDRHWHW